MGAKPEWQSMQGIGYHEFMDAIWRGDGPSSIKALESLGSDGIQAIKDKIVMNSIHYAKRQMTFFRSFADVHWISPDDTQGLSALLDGFLG